MRMQHPFFHAQAAHPFFSDEGTTFVLIQAHAKVTIPPVATCVTPSVARRSNRKKASETSKEEVKKADDG